MTARKLIGVTQRVVWNRGERRDALDQAWTIGLEMEGAVAVPLGNALEDPQGFLDEVGVSAIVLTGGNDLACVGGDDIALERDRLEATVLDWASSRQVPVLGVCRGMQFIANQIGSSVVPVSGHVATEHSISWRLDFGLPDAVNSFHRFGIRTLSPQLEVLAVADDGSVEALRHESLPWVGVMWHPERLPEYPCGPLALLDRLLTR